MKLLQRLPGSRKEPHGLEWKVLRKMPIVLLAGTVAAGAYALLARLFINGGSVLETARMVQLNDYFAVGVVIFLWTVVLTVSIFCAIVVVMKGHAYVADRYDLPDSPEPKE